MTNVDLIKQAKLARDSDTLYVTGCFGAPLNARMKERYTKNNAYNKRPERTAKILAASDDTFGFDCICLVKGLLWGWNADPDRTYGGATYGSNGILDTSISVFLSRYCDTASDDFTKIEPGEFLVDDDLGHCGIYIGNGYAIESTPIWKDGVQQTEVWNICRTVSEGRVWAKHAKIKSVEYLPIPEKQSPIEVTIISDEALTADQMRSIREMVLANNATVTFAVRKEVT